MLRFRVGLVRMEGLTVEIKLRLTWNRKQQCSYDTIVNRNDKLHSACILFIGLNVDFF